MMENAQNQTINSVPDAVLAFLQMNGAAPTEMEGPNTDLCKFYYQLGKLYYDKADLFEAQVNFVHSIKFADFPKDTFTAFKTLGFLIRISSEKLEDEAAKKYIADAEKLIEFLANDLGNLSSDYFYNIGILHNYKGEFDKAGESFLFAKNKSKMSNEPELLAKSLLALAINEYNMNRLEKALDYLNELEELLKIVNKSYLKGSMYFYAAKIYSRLEDFDKALNYYSMANKVLHHKKCWNLFGYTLLGKGVVYKRMGSYDKALDLFELAKESVDTTMFKRLNSLIEEEVCDVQDSSVDLYLDRNMRVVTEKQLGTERFPLEKPR